MYLPPCVCLCTSLCIQDLTKETGIDLENIVYYKDDTHYFVMTAKKDSLLKKKVLISVSKHVLSHTIFTI